MKKLDFDAIENDFRIDESGMLLVGKRMGIPNNPQLSDVFLRKDIVPHMLCTPAEGKGTELFV